MSIRKPLLTVLNYNDAGNVGATSIVSQTFFVPQDADNILVKVPVASISGTNPTYDVYLQTTDDGGTTWYDILRLPTITGTIANAGAFWGNANVNGLGVRTTLGPQVSVLGGGPGSSILSITGNASMRGLAAGAISGLPIMGPLNRVQLTLGGTIATNDGVQVQVKVNSQEASA